MNAGHGRGRGARPTGWFDWLPFSSGVRRAFGAVVMLATSLATIPASAAIYYVDNSGANCSSAGPGTEAQPYCTISAAVAAHRTAGTIIRVKPGLYREMVTVPTSGTSSSPYVFEATGPGVIVDGSDDCSSPALWSRLLRATSIERAASTGARSRCSWTACGSPPPAARRPCCP